MDDYKESQLKSTQASLSPPNTTTTHMRKSQETQIIKLSQIYEKPLDPDSNTDQVVYDTSGEPRSYKRKRAVVNNMRDHAETKSSVVERAEELLSNLDDSSPSFMKTLVRSNVSYGYWMHLPMRFCKLHMPRHDTTFSLDTEREVHKVHYIAERTALSGGWKAFATLNELREGDVLVFHLVEPSKFKVYVVKASPLVAVTGVSALNKIDSDGMENDSDTCKNAKCLELLPVDHSQENCQISSQMVLDASYSRHVADHSENDSQGLCSKVLIVTRSSGTEYYELCCSQNSFLHEHLLKSINYKLAAEIIAQTVNIAEAIRASKLFTSQADYAIWNKTLKGFELLGMNVEFLRVRLERLISLAFEADEAWELQRCREVELEQARTEEEMRTLDMKISKLKKSIGRLDAEMENLKVKADRHELMFQEEVNAPW
ncbi:B3 domain-containing protein/DUF724 domain-containing protein [Cephalotus follicularis]|uniref:B3 domain-containing protein/DUF724 domain-containing protein n=1 Tax=Cephalotus follicularis TaxID=3775 RepID=A0A1Q3BES6_CEPFO|nr:B3 domain-containing protein/DUF724 domain-containing protein [Cephalotus follicularis]